MKNIRILILDDEAEIRQELKEFLVSQGFSIFEAANPSEAFRILKEQPIDISILDIRLPEMSGLQVLREVKKMHPTMEVIMISGHGDMDSVIEALRSGAEDFLKKPFQLREVLHSIEKTSKFVQQSKLMGQLQLFAVIQARSRRLLPVPQRGVKYENLSCHHFPLSFCTMSPISSSSFSTAASIAR